MFRIRAHGKSPFGAFSCHMTTQRTPALPAWFACGPCSRFVHKYTVADRTMSAFLLVPFPICSSLAQRSRDQGTCQANYKMHQLNASYSKAMPLFLSICLLEASAVPLACHASLTPCQLTVADLRLNVTPSVPKSTWPATPGPPGRPLRRAVLVMGICTSLIPKP